MKLEEKEILNQMKKIRFLRNGIEEIELYTALNEKLREYNDVECIPELCEIMEDDVDNCSAIEEVLETILILVKGKQMKLALEKIISSTLQMKNHADAWARILHTQLLKDKDVRKLYIECVNEADYETKEYIKEIYEKLKKKKRIKDIDMDALINSIN